MPGGRTAAGPRQTQTPPSERRCHQEWGGVKVGGDSWGVEKSGRMKRTRVGAEKMLAGARDGTVFGKRWRSERDGGREGMVVGKGRWSPTDGLVVWKGSTTVVGGQGDWVLSSALKVVWYGMVARLYEDLLDAGGIKNVVDHG